MFTASLEKGRYSAPRDTILTNPVAPRAGNDGPVFTLVLPLCSCSVSEGSSLAYTHSHTPRVAGGTAL